MRSYVAQGHSCCSQSAVVAEPKNRPFSVNATLSDVAVTFFELSRSVNSRWAIFGLCHCLSDLIVVMN